MVKILVRRRFCGILGLHAEQRSQRDLPYFQNETHLFLCIICVLVMDRRACIPIVLPQHGRCRQLLRRSFLTDASAVIEIVSTGEPCELPHVSCGESLRDSRGITSRMLRSGTRRQYTDMNNHAFRYPDDMCISADSRFHSYSRPWLN